MTRVLTNIVLNAGEKPEKFKEIISVRSTKKNYRKLTKIFYDQKKNNEMKIRKQSISSDSRSVLKL